MKKIKSYLILIFSLNILLSGSYCAGETIKDYLEEVLPYQEGRRIVINTATGVLTITDTPTNHKLIRMLIKEWDVGPRQISIEAKFIELREGVIDEMGIEWYGTRSDTQYQVGVERRRKKHNFYIGDGPQRGTNDEGTPVTVPPAYDENISGAEEAFDYRYDAWASPPWSGTEWGAPNQPAGVGLWVGKSSMSGSGLFGYLKALESTSKVNVLSSPRVTTLSGQMANIELAVTAPYASSVDLTDTGRSAFGQYETYEIEEKKTGVFLEVTPSVAEGGNIITLDLHPEVSEVVRKVPLSSSDQFPEYLGWPIVDTRSMQTSITIRSGETIVIGGLMRDDEVVTERKVPFLGNIPILGNLFKYKLKSREKTNLVIFLKATLVSAEGEELK
ncbi:MAG: hypothetical protein KAJ66_05835 [Candidatus Omnitrophica bacterium]|nr:hypothetical protein [Candidatus Omnitrophota bacterium]